MLQSKNLHVQNTLKSDSGNLGRREQVTGYREGERLRIRQLCGQDRWGEVWCHQSRKRAKISTLGMLCARVGGQGAAVRSPLFSTKEPELETIYGAGPLETLSPMSLTGGKGTFSEEGEKRKTVQKQLMLFSPSYVWMA